MQCPCDAHDDDGSGYHETLKLILLAVKYVTCMKNYMISYHHLTIAFFVLETL